MAHVQLDLDPFAAEFLADPYPRHQLMRDAGAVLRLTRYNIWGLARYAEVSSALQDWKTFCSGRGGGLTDFAREPMAVRRPTAQATPELAGRSPSLR